MEADVRRDRGLQSQQDRQAFGDDRRGARIGCLLLAHRIQRVEDLHAGRGHGVELLALHVIVRLLEAEVDFAAGGCQRSVQLRLPPGRRARAAGAIVHGLRRRMPHTPQEAVRTLDPESDQASVCSGGLVNIMKKRAVSAPY